MPITKSAKKALRQSKKRRMKNLVQKGVTKDAVKEFRALVAAKKTEEAKKILPAVYKALDKAAKSNLIKKNTASRKKARLSQALNKLLAKQQ